MSDVSLASALDALLRFGALMLRSGEAAFRVREDMVLLAPRLGIERFSMLVTLTTLTASGWRGSFASSPAPSTTATAPGSRSRRRRSA